MLQDFKAFIMRGNVMDLAVGVIIGAAFGKIVESMVRDVIMPVVGLALGKIDFANLFILLSEGKTPGPYPSLDSARKAGASVFAYGDFINALVNFLIIGFVVFLLVRAVQAVGLKKDAAPPKTPEDVLLLREIRDALKAR
jgi:large conductance mechanosensitive channel